MAMIELSPPRSLSELDDDSTSSLGSGDWTDLSSAHADDVSDSASVDGSEPRVPLDTSDVWTTAEALSASSAYASVPPPLAYESDGESERSVRPPEPHTLQLILPDPLERSGSTAADLSFSDDAVLATNPAAVVSLAGAHPSVAQRSAVVSDVLRAIAKATHSSLVRADYCNFTTLSELPTRVHNPAPPKEISVLVRDHTTAPLVRLSAVRCVC
jgi:hypothetical protein